MSQEPPAQIANYRGAVAQLGEHLLCKQGVVGSSPISSTTTFELKNGQLPIVWGWPFFYLTAVGADWPWSLDVEPAPEGVFYLTSKLIVLPPGYLSPGGSIKFLLAL